MRKLAAVVLVCCAGCDRGEVRALESRQLALDTRLAEAQEAAQTLNERRALLDRVEQRLASFGASQQVELSRVLQALAAVAPREVVPARNGGGLRVAGGGGARGAAAAWHALGPLASGLWLRRAEVSEGNWLLELQLSGPELPAATSRVESPPWPPAPAQGWFCLERCQRLRTRGADTERRLAELGKIVAEAERFEQRRVALEAQFEQLGGTLGAWLGVLDAWFGAERPLLDAGRLEVTGRGGRLTGFPLGKASQAALAVKALADASAESSAEVRVRLR